MNKPREFWLSKYDCNFDLNWRHVEAAEFPHKDTIDDETIHVVEYSALEAERARSAKLIEALEAIADYRTCEILFPGQKKYKSYEDGWANVAKYANDVVETYNREAGIK